MGGTIALTLRTPKNKEYRMNRWTNILPDAITNYWLTQKHPEHINHIMRSWRQMRTDYNKNKSTGKFENNMTGVYFPSQGLVPVGYGLVVVDMVNSVILSNQGYTSIGRIYSDYYMFKDIIEMYGNVDKAVEELQRQVKRNKPNYDESKILTFATLHEHGRIREYLKWDRVHNKPETIDISNMPLKDIFTACLDRDGMFSDGMGFPIDLSPFTVEKFDASKSSYMEMKARVLDLGFKLTVKEEAAWDRFLLEELYEDEEEDEDD